MSAITDLIDQVAAQQGVDPRLAEAIAYRESGFDPLAIGDSGHSVGLFQLNDLGLGHGLSVAQREDPRLNATVALRELASSRGQYADPGQWAAASQKPRDPVAYAAGIDQLLRQPAAFMPGPGGIPIPDPFGGQGPLDPGKGLGDIGAGIGAIGGAIAGIPAGIGHGLADAMGATTHNIGVFLQRQFVALAVAAVILLVLFQ